MKQIIVGVDGSEQSLQAAEWAAEEAVRRGTSVRIIYAIAPWLFDTSVDPRAGAVREWLRDSGQDVVGQAVVRAHRRAPEAKVSSEVVPGGPAQALIKEAGHAAMIVVASRGAGELTGLLLGSVALQVASYAPAPIVVVRHQQTVVHREVVVGVDGSESCAAAIGFAFEEAMLRGARLRAVLAWRHPVSTAPGDMQPLIYDPEVVMAEEERTLMECLAGRREKYPDVEVVHEVVHDRPVRALTGASARADLLVVGTRGRGGFTGLMLGSVSHAMLHHAHCPLAVVPLSAADADG